MSRHDLDFSQPRAVVLIDQHDQDQELFRRAVRACGVTCSFVALASPELAFEYFFANPVSRGAAPAADLIVIDLLPAAPALPSLDAPKLLRLLQNSHRLGDDALPPIVAFSRAESDAALRQAYALGASSYVFKPDKEDLFVDTVLQMLGFWLQLNRRPGLLNRKRWRRTAGHAILDAVAAEEATEWLRDTTFTEIGP